MYHSVLTCMTSPEPNWKLALERLHLLSVYIRWTVVLLCWLTFGAYALWQLKEEYALLQEYFTWAAVRYGLAFHPTAAFSLFLCFGLTGVALVYTSLYFLLGISKSKEQQLLKEVKKIYLKGSSHPLYSWLYGSKENRKL
jgi:hypothetical protein